jgi:hypothetical protein
MKMRWCGRRRRSRTVDIEHLAATGYPPGWVAMWPGERILIADENAISARVAVDTSTGKEYPSDHAVGYRKRDR